MQPFSQHIASYLLNKLANLPEGQPPVWRHNMNRVARSLDYPDIYMRRYEQPSSGAISRLLQRPTVTSRCSLLMALLRSGHYHAAAHTCTELGVLLAGPAPQLAVTAANVADQLNCLEETTQCLLVTDLPRMLVALDGGHMALLEALVARDHPGERAGAALLVCSALGVSIPPSVHLPLLSLASGYSQVCPQDVAGRPVVSPSSQELRHLVRRLVREARNSGANTASTKLATTGDLISIAKRSLDVKMAKVEIEVR